MGNTGGRGLGRLACYGAIAFTTGWGEMGSETRQAEVPVLLLHNLDPSWGHESTHATLCAVERMKAALEKEGHPVVEVPVRHPDLAQILKPFDPDDVVVFNWCEELPGLIRSDVTVVGVLEEMRFTYTGSAVDVLALSWNKPACKSLMDQSGIPTPRWQLVTPGSQKEWVVFPAIVKPAFEHCSVGITSEAVVTDPRELLNRIEFVHNELKQPAIVEAFIDGREFHVTLVGNGSVQVLPPAEMDYTALSSLKERICSYDSKFTPGSIPYESIEIRVPAQLEAEEEERLLSVVMKTYRVFQCRDYGRIDLRCLNGHVYVLDVNPNPDVSPDTSLALAAEAAGLAYGKMASRLVRLAAARHPLFGACL